MNVEKWIKAYNKPAPKKQGAKNAVKGIDKYDKEDLAAMRSQIRAYSSARQRLCGVAEDTGGHLTDDATMSFFKVDPELMAMDAMDDRFKIDRAVIDKLMGTPEYERLRTWTAGDIINTAISFVDVEPILEQLFDKAQKDLNEKAEEIERIRGCIHVATQEAANLDELIEHWKEGGIFDPEGEEVQGAQDAADQLAKGIGELTDQLAEAIQALDDSAESKAKAIAPEARQAMNDAADKAEEMADAARGFGLDPGQLRRMPADQRIKLAARLDSNERFKRLAALIGPMMRLAAAEQTRKTYHSFEEVYDIEMGADLSRLVPSELLALANPLTKLDFYRRWSEKKLLEYAMRGEEKLGKGGILFCMDNSGSMAGDREIWAKAVGLATLAIAKDQKRSFHGLHFSSQSELKAYDFSTPDKVTLDAVMDYAEWFFGNGTNFVRPLSEALKLLQTEEKEKGFTEGDIVFVTDGMCSVPPDFLAEFIGERERLDFKVHGILIGGGSRTSEPLHSICDGNIVTIQDLLSGEDVRSMFRDL